MKTEKGVSTQINPAALQRLARKETRTRKETLTHDYVSIRFSTVQRDWLFELAERETKTHKADCLCMACKCRRQLAP